MARKFKPGTFRPGPDPRRHVFTPEQRRRGGQRRARQLLAEMHVASYGIAARHDAAELEQLRQEAGALFDNSPAAALEGD